VWFAARDAFLQRSFAARATAAAQVPPEIRLAAADAVAGLLCAHSWAHQLVISPPCADPMSYTHHDKMEQWLTESYIWRGFIGTSSRCSCPINAPIQPLGYEALPRGMQLLALLDPAAVVKRNLGHWFYCDCTVGL
jgi:hypothetical protein